MKRIGIAAIGFLVLAGVIGVLVSLGGAGPSSLRTSAEGGAGAEPASGSATGVAMAPMPSPAPGAFEPGAFKEASRTTAYAGDQIAQEQAGAPATVPGTSGSYDDLVGVPPTQVGPRVVKTASLSVEVKKDGFASAFDEASLVAQKYHGFVVDSATSGDKSRSGSLLIRVPAASFDLAMSDLRGLGNIDHQDISGQDVTDQFVDLNARLTTWQAQERVLLRLMNRANSIGETMTVQRELQQVQYQIEDIQGQLRVLRDETALSTISVTIHEPGVVPGPKPTKTPSLVRAWQTAVAGFLSVIALVIIGLGYLVPLTAVGAVCWLVYRKVRPRLAN